jgi:hypothetical protein
LEQDDERGGGDRETDDPVREDESAPALGERAWHEMVLRVEVREPWEVGERRVRGQDQDQRRPDLEPDEQRRTQRAAAEHGAADLGDDGLRLRRSDLKLHREEREPQEHHAQEASHPHQRRPGIPPFGRLEGGDSVRDRLDTGHSRTSRRERVQDQEEADRPGGLGYVGRHR